MKKEDNLNVLRVAGNSEVSSVAGSIVKSIEDGKDVELRAIGASAINQTVKALATARGILATKSIDIVFKPGFTQSVINGQERTIMLFKVVIL